MGIDGLFALAGAQHGVARPGVRPSRQRAEPGADDRRRRPERALDDAWSMRLLSGRSLHAFVDRYRASGRNGTAPLDQDADAERRRRLEGDGIVVVEITDDEVVFRHQRTAVDPARGPRDRPRAAFC
jgi:hypothetical protein